MDNHPKPYGYVLNLAIIMVITCLCISGEIYAQTKLINPHLSNSYLDSYVLPDSTVRFIGSEHGRNRELFYVDKLTDGTITDPFFLPESIGDLEFNFAGVDCKMVPLKSGDVLLGINQSDCDYVPYSSLAKFNIDGEVVWAVSMEYFNFNYLIHKLTRVDSNVICLISDELDTLYFDLDGNEVEVSLQYEVYDTVVTAQFGYYATVGGSLFCLDEHFKVIDSVTLENDILAISPSGDSLTIVSTTSALVLLDANLDVAVHSAVFMNYDLIANSTNWVWIGQENGDIIKLDYLLQPHDTIPIQKDIQLKSMVVIGEMMTLGGNYIGAAASSVFFHTTDPGQFSFDIKKDIALESISIEEPIFYSFEPFAEPWGFNIPYKNVVVTVTNTGQDTIQTLTILYGAGSGCFFCQGESHRWGFDSLNLYPGLQMDIELDDFSVWCVTQSPTKFCLSILPADSLPETDRLNNRLCVDVNAFLTGVNEAGSSAWTVSPNPADNFITIHIDDPIIAEYQGVIINGRGELVERFQLLEGSSELDLVDYLPGIYFLIIMNSQGVCLSKKLSVIH